MRKTIFLTLLGLMPFIFIQSLNQQPMWQNMNFIHTEGYHNGNMVISKSGTNYSTITFRAGVTIDNQNFYSKGVQDLMVIQFGNDLSHQWKTIISPYNNWGTITPTSINADTNGNVFVSVYFSGDIYSNGIYVSSMNGNTALIKINAMGNVEWIRPFFSPGNGSANTAFDSAGNIYFNNRSSNLYKLTSMGETVWEKTYPTYTVFKVEVSDNQLFVAGTLHSGYSYEFGTVVIDDVNVGYAGYVAKADLDGNYNSVQRLSQGISYVNDLIISGSNVIIAGYFRKDLSLSPALTINKDVAAYSVFVAKADMNLQFNTLKNSADVVMTNTNAPFFLGITDNGSNGLYLKGIYLSNINFDGVDDDCDGRAFLVGFDENLNRTRSTALPFFVPNQISLTNDGNILETGTNSIGTGIGNAFVSLWDMNGSLLNSFSTSDSKFGSVVDRSIVQNADGSYFLKTYYRGTIQIWNTVFYSEHDKTLITKHNADGSLRGFQEISDIQTDVFGSSMTTDKDGNLIQIGLFNDNFQIGPLVLNETNNGQEAYICKFDPDLNLIWAKTLNNGEVTNEISVATDNNGNIIVGYMRNPDNVVVKFNPAGDKLWSREFPMESYYLMLVSCDKDNNIYMSSEVHFDAGSTQTRQFGDINLTQSVNNSSTLVMKLDPNGNPLWGKFLGENYSFNYTDGWPTAIKNDADGNLYVWGWCRNGDQFGDMTVQSPFTPMGNYNYLLTKLDAMGNILWANPVYEKTFGFNYGDLLAIDQSGDVYVAGTSRDSVMVSGHYFSPGGTSDQYFLKFHPDGNLSWVKKVEQNTIKYVGGISSAIDNQLLVLGEYSGQSNFDGQFSDLSTGLNVYTGILTDNYPYTRLYTENMSVMRGNEFMLPFYSESNENLDVISYQFSVFFNQNELEFLGADISGTASENGQIIANNNEWGVIYISFMSKDPIDANTLLLKLRFIAKENSESTIYTDDLYYNDRRIYDSPYCMINVYENLMGDIDFNSMVQAYDAALTLQYSVGMDPLPEMDPRPWEDLRWINANVDKDNNITANDAALILQYSAHLIQNFDSGAVAMGVPLENTADLKFEYNDNMLSVLSLGRLIGMNMFADNSSQALGKPVFGPNNDLKAYHEANGEYSLGIANLNPLADGDLLVKIPVTREQLEKITFHVYINDQEAWIKGAVISGTDNTKIRQALVYPNPVQDVLYVNLEQAGKLEIFDMQGRNVLKMQLEAGKNLIPAGSWNKGIYLLKITDANGLLRQNIIKQ